MTKKDYILIANTIISLVNQERLSTDQTSKIIDIFALKLGLENPRFDANKFSDFIYKEILR